MNQKLFSIDLDGTILHDNKVSTTTKKVLHEALKKGHIVLINSGRPLHHMREIVKTFNISDEALEHLYIASDNGCSLINYKTNEVFYYKTLDDKILKELWKRAIEDGLNPFNHNTNVSYYYKLTPFVEKTLKGHKVIYPQLKNVFQKDTLDDITDQHFAKFTFIEDKREEYAVTWLNSIAEEYNLTPVHSERTFFMLASKGLTKAMPIEMLQKKYNLARNDTYIFGDSDNDIESFVASPNIVVPSSAAENVKKKAKIIIGNSEDDAVANFIHNLINSDEKQ